MGKIKKKLLLALGFGAFGLGTLGIFLPVIPTVPLYLLAAFCFTGSSERVSRWFMGTSLYKKHLLPYLKAGGMTARGKALLILFVGSQMAIGAFFAREHVLALILIAVLFLCFLFSILFAVKTISKKDKGGAKKSNRREKKSLCKNKKP
ncbi:MAG: YbaN family protein [Clostridia bacterium]|nr:YbaN family protein [Clostridia bacterium]